MNPSDAKMTYAQAAALHMQRVNENVSLKARARTRLYWKVVLASLLKTWPELAELEIRRGSPTACRAWAARHAKGFQHSD